MVYKNSDKTAVKGPYQEVRKGQQQQQQQPGQPAKKPADNKNGAWGPIYKNKENFVNMHCC